MTIRLNGSTSGYVEIDAPAVAGTTTVTLPSSSVNLSNSFGPWTSYTPTIGGVTLGNGSATGGYAKLGRTVIFWAQFGVGSTTTFSGNIFITLPFTANSQYALQATLYNPAVGFYPIWCYASGNAAEMFVVNTAGTYGVLEYSTSTKPATHAANFRYYVSGSYEATT